MEYMNFPKGFFVGIKDVRNPDGFSVSQNQPNPANHSTKIIVTLDKPATVHVTIRNLLGGIIKQFQPLQLNQGENTVMMDVRGILPGLYFYTVEVGTQKSTQKMIIQ
jgi:hypothetical protein